MKHSNISSSLYLWLYSLYCKKDLNDLFASYSESFLTNLIWSWQRNLRDIAKLYGIESSLDSIEEYRKTSGLQSITSRCFKAARISALLIDDGIQLDKKHDLEWHKPLVKVVGRILRIERLAESILDEVGNLSFLKESQLKSILYCYTSLSYAYCLTECSCSFQDSLDSSLWTLNSFTKSFEDKLKSYPFSYICV